MKTVAVGVEPVGVIAIGANATGIVAIGQLATGVIAIGQLARGWFVVGQLAIGFDVLGQLVFGMHRAVGMVGVAGVRGTGLVASLLSKVTPWRVVLVLALVAFWWLSTGMWVLDALVREGGILRDAPRPLR